MKKALAFLLSLTMILPLFSLTTFAKGFEYPPDKRILVGMQDNVYESGKWFTPSDFPDVKIEAIEEDDVPGFYLFTLSAWEEILNNYNNAIDRLKKYPEIKYAAAEKLLCNATIDENFLEDEIIVSIQGKYNKEKEIFTVEDFPEIGCIEVEEILFSESACVRKLCLKISPAGKQNVLDAIKKLESNPKIQSAQPNYFIEWPEEPGYDCAHEWENATCIAPKTCKLCGATEGEKNPDHHTHPMTADVVCYDRYCSDCGQVQSPGDPLIRGLHDFDVNSLFCELCGKTEFEIFGNHLCKYDVDGKCPACHRVFSHLEYWENEEYAKSIVPLSYCEFFGHTPGAEATKTEAQTCTVCGAVLKEATGKGNPHTAADDLFGAMAMLSLATAAAVLLKKKR